ncbi:hypothetical protein M513_04060, partial [Trichuris suis]
DKQLCALSDRVEIRDRFKRIIL